MSDLYQNFEDLRHHNILGTDYQIRYQKKQSGVLFKAIHGGGIEPGTSELAELSAGVDDSYYCFEGIRSTGNSELHITSIHFDEPTAIEVVSQSLYTVSYHGYAGGQVKNTIVGGLDDKLALEVTTELKLAGFNADQSGRTMQIGGRNPANIVNKNHRGKGVQLEISFEQRKVLFDNFSGPQRRQTVNRTFYEYIEAIKKALNQVKI
ncbi:poly-gamma-glutamate hydrolase family protein [Alkalicoccobacillus porphyridii]|uniref:Replication protein n=1 Tax=Alkalicoccobacillus porphyridii TaxID=2597270 RepID=A0A553ZW58_9BACI|nr:poly-gamma-glutamate hydrolase family protein [Alkalicoccobacillus porphyridii]TSB45710.1 replication protein [Alkalicoccobacillus porphyridii]